MILPADIGDPVADAQRETLRQLELERERQVAMMLHDLEGDVTRVLGRTLEKEIEHGYAEETARLYTADFKRFQRWCKEAEVPLPSLPAHPQTVAAFLIAMGGDIPPIRSIIRMHAAIAHRHQVTQNINPCDDVLVRATMRWLREKLTAAKREGLNGSKLNGHAKGNGSALKDANHIAEKGCH